MSRRVVRLPVLPPVGPCRLSRWLAKPGADLDADQPYAEIDSDKAVMELRAPAAARLVEQCVAEGGALEEGSVVAVLELTGEAIELVPTLHYRRFRRESS